MGLPAFISTDETIDVVVSADDSIDHEKSDFKRYYETLEMSALAFKEGSTPTVFTISPLGAQDLGLSIAALKRNAADGGDVDYTPKLNIVRHCLKGVRGLFRYEAKDGAKLRDVDAWEKKEVEFKTKKTGHGFFAREVADESVINWISPVAVEELYLLIDKISTIDDTRKKH